MGTADRGEVCVVGAGGHAKVVIRLLQELGYRVKALFDDNPRKWGQSLLGIPIVGPPEEGLGNQVPRAVIAIGDNATRKAVVQRLPWEWITVVHPRAFVDASVELGVGSVFLPGAVVQVGSVVGSHVVINTNASVDHDCVVGDFVHVGPGAHVTADCHLKEGCFLGAGTVTKPGTHIGSWTTVGAGAAVVQNLPGHVVALGVPARISRCLVEIAHSRNEALPGEKTAS